MILEINHKTKYKYVEFSFCLPINDLFYEICDTIDLKPDGKEIDFITKLLDIKWNKEKVEKDYWDDTNEVQVYHSSVDREIFVYFDMIRDPHDQCDMIFIGIRCHRDSDSIVRDKLLELYLKSSPRSNFQIDYFNQSLYMTVFNSDFYFYKREENKNWKLVHFNLES